MSLYEVLAVVVLVGAGGFAWHLYRKDTRPRAPGEAPPPVSGEKMFRRDKGLLFGPRTSKSASFSFMSAGFTKHDPSFEMHRFAVLFRMR